MSKVIVSLALLFSLVALAISGYVLVTDISAQNGIPKASRQVVLGLTNDWCVGKVIQLE